MLIQSNILKLFYRALLTGLPFTTYNPLKNSPFHAPMTVCKGSTYVNYKLNENQFNYLRDNLDITTNDLELKSIKLNNYDKEKDYYVSVNMYNCTSPMFEFMSQHEMTRCEINTYVHNKDNVKGTLIMDYSANLLSMDPDNIFKVASKSKFKTNNLGDRIFEANSKDIDFFLQYKYNDKKDKRFIMSEDLIKYTDNIYYNNGIIDKLYYDSSLTCANTRIPNKIKNVSFRFRNLELTNPTSIFYFENDVKFVGALWNNLINYNE